MQRTSFYLAILVTAGLAGCAVTPEQARQDISLLGFQAGPMAQQAITEQAEALQNSSQRIVRASTAKGAALGLAVGCGVGLLSANAASSCARAAAVGAISGAVAGRKLGAGDVNRWVEIASPNALVRNIRAANDHLADIQTSLPDVLARQDAELLALSDAHLMGQMSSAEYTAGVARIKVERANLAEALSLSAAEARRASDNLREAQRRGQTGLEWHIGAVSELENAALSVRSDIKLL